LDDTGARNQHTVFLDSVAEAAAFDPVKALNTHPDLIKRAYNRPRLETLQTREVQMDEADAGAEEALEKEKAKKYRTLTERAKRERQLRNLRTTLETKKQLQKKGRRKVVAQADGDRPAIYEWRKQRAR